MKARPALIIAWLAHSMRWVLMTPFGWPVEPEVNRILAIVSGPTLACAASTAGSRLRASERCEQRRAPVRRRIGGDDDLDIARHGCGDGAREGGAVGGEDQARRENADDGFELAEILRHQRIGHRDRRVRNADMHGGKAEQRVLDIVAGENGDRPLGRKIALQQRRGDGANRRERLRVSQRAPAAGGVALRQEHALGRGLRPMHQPLGEVFRGYGRSGCGERIRIAPSPRRSTTTSGGPSLHRPQRRLGCLGQRCLRRCAIMV